MRANGRDATGGRDVLLQHLREVAERCVEDARERQVAVATVGIATAGWVNPYLGRVVYATENLPGWTGTEIGTLLDGQLGIPVAVENDANALALAEQHFGAGRESATLFASRWARASAGDAASTGS